MSTVYINGRFLTQRTTGVQRYALETLLAIDALFAAGRGVPATKLVLLAPPGTRAPPLQTIAFRTVGPLSGNAWEQLSLPLATRGELLLSFSATGPLLKRSQIVTMHDAAVHVVPQAFSRNFRSWYKLLLPILARRTPHVMTVSEFSKHELVRYFGAREHRTHVTGEGWQHVTRHTSDASVLTELGLAPRSYALAVSSVTPHKNFAAIARAAARLEDSALSIVVAGSVDAAVFGRTDLAALRSVKLAGYVDDHKLRALYENAAVFIYPSLYEGFGIPPLEAMALGCPVLASSAAAIPETCGDAAWYFAPEDDKTLAELMTRLLHSEADRAALIEKGHRRIKDFSWEACAQRFIEVLGEVLASR
jgi:glycosyltransferase involved in cell wall biosynthesis